MTTSFFREEASLTRWKIYKFMRTETRLREKGSRCEDMFGMELLWSHFRAREPS